MPPPSSGHGGSPRPGEPLRIAYLTYRGKPHVGGQGVYTRHLTKALVDLGHHVEVLGGQPYPVLDERVPLVELPSLDIYNDHFPMRDARPLGAQALAGLRRGHRVLDRHVPRAARPSACGPGDHLRRPRATTSTSSTTTSASATACSPSSARPARRSPRSTTRSPSTGASSSSTRRTRCKRLIAAAAGTRSSRCRPGSPGDCRGSSPCRENSINDIHRDHGVDPRAPARRARSASTPSCSGRCPTSTRSPGRLITTASADVAMKGLALPARGAGQAAHRARDVTLVVIGQPEGGRSPRAAIERARPRRRRDVRVAA